MPNYRRVLPAPGQSCNIYNMSFRSRPPEIKQSVAFELLDMQDNENMLEQLFLIITERVPILLFSSLLADR